MVDTNKRHAVKILAGTAVMASVPTLASATGQFSIGPAIAETIGTDSETGISRNTKAELSIELSVDPIPTIRLTNNSKELIVVRHLHPGIVNAGAKAFDLNSIFSQGAYAIDSGSSRNFRISPISNTQAETQFPRQIYRNKPLRVVSVRGSDRHGEIVNSTRSFYA